MTTTSKPSWQSRSIGSARLNNKLIEAVDIFKGSKPYPDDIAVLTCKYTIN
jgi:hypothetical protein